MKKHKNIKKYQVAGNNNPALDLPTSRYKKIGNQWYELQNGNYVPVDVNPDAESGIYSANDKNVKFKDYSTDGITNNANLDSDGYWRKNEITENPNNLEYSGFFKGLNSILDLTRGVANTITNAKVKQDEKNKYLKAIYPKAEENIYASGLNNIPVYFKTGGKLSAKKARKILHDGTIHGKPITDQQRKYFGAVSSGYIKQNGGYINETGYLPEYETSTNPYNIIPSNILTMDGVPHDIIAYPNIGNPKLMKAGSGKYKFPKADYVIEIPEVSNDNEDDNYEDDIHIMQVGGSNYSIVDYLNNIHQASDFNSRKELAKRAGIQNYSGTAEQNIQLLNLLKGNHQSAAPKQTVAFNSLFEDNKIFNYTSNTKQVNKPNTQTNTKKINTQTKNNTVSNNPNIKPVVVNNNDYQGFENDKQLYFAKKAALANNGRFVLTDKATNRTFYGTYDPKNDKFDVNGFEVLTGEGKDIDIYDNKSLDEMEKLEKQGKDITKYKITPVGFYPLSKNPNIYGAPGLNVGNTQIAYHKTYQGADDMTRAKRYNNKNNNDNYISYGCINCQKPSIAQLMTFVGDNPMDALIMNSNKYYKENAQNMQKNSPETFKKLNIQFQQGGNNIDEVESVPEGVADAELEQGEVFTNNQGQIQKVAESEPTHEDGGSYQNNVHRVLEDTADKRKDLDSKLLKITPTDAEKLVGFKPKISTSHSKLFELASEFYDKKLKKTEKIIQNSLDYAENSGGNYAKNSLEQNVKLLKDIPTKADLFDLIYKHQEIVKSLNNIGQNNTMKNGGKYKPKYQVGNTDSKITDEIRKSANLISKTPKTATLLGSEDNKTYYMYDPITGKQIPVGNAHTGSKTKLSNEDYVKMLATKNYDVNDLIAKKWIHPSFKDLYEIERQKNFPSEHPTYVYTQDPRVSGSITILPDNIGILPDSENTNANNDLKYNFNKPVTPSEFNEPLRWYDVATDINAFLGSLEPAPVPLEQLKRDPLKVHELNPLPALQQNQADYNTALKSLPNNGVGFANQANLQAQKYKVSDEILGQYENINKGKYDAIDQYNDQSSYNTDVTNLNLRDTFNQRVAQRNENQRLQKLKAMDNLFTKIAQNRKLNREGNLIMQLTPYFDQYGKFNGNQYMLIDGGDMLNIVNKNTGKLEKKISKNMVDKNGNLSSAETTITKP